MTWLGGSKPIRSNVTTPTSLLRVLCHRKFVTVSQSVSQSDQLFWQWIISLFPRVFLAEKPLCILFRIWLIWLDSYDKWKAPWACKSLAFGSRFTSFSSVLPTSQVGYHAGKPIVSVVYCFYKITDLVYCG